MSEADPNNAVRAAVRALIDAAELDAEACERRARMLTGMGRCGLAISACAEATAHRFMAEAARAAIGARKP